MQDKRERELMKDTEVAERLNVSPWTLRSWRSQRKGLPFLKLGGSARYRPEDVEEFLERRTMLPTRD